MISKKAEQLLDNFAYSLAKSLGFDPLNNDFFGRPKHDAIAMISFPRRISARGTCLFTIGIGLRFPSLAKWLDFDNEGSSAIGQPIHFLRKDRTYTEWEFSNAEDLERLRDIIVDDLKKYAFPYIDRYSQISELRKALESSNKQEWLNMGLNVDSRVTVLAAIQFVEGEKLNAIKTLDEGLKNLQETLAGRTHELRKRRFAMEYLKERFVTVTKTADNSDNM